MKVLYARTDRYIRIWSNDYGNPRAVVADCRKRGAAWRVRCIGTQVIGGSVHVLDEELVGTSREAVLLGRRMVRGACAGVAA